MDQEGSLHPDETLYMNGRLWKACEALEHAKKEGRLVEEQEDRKIYDAGDTTRSLNSEGEIEEAECMVYEKEYDGKTYSLETKTGRQIRVSGNHPFLVNRSGEIEWVKAFELEEDDFLVAPDRLEIEESESGSHGEILESMRNDYRVVRRKRVRQLNQKLESGESLNSKEIDDLRIASGLTKKELAAEAGVSYESVLNYLEGAENGIEEDLREAIQERKIEEGDYVEDFRVHRIGEISEYEAGFLVGFAMAEGEIGENSISVWQKNLEDKIDEWIKVAENAGLKVSTRKKDSCREAKISSKPFLDYLEKRFSIDSPAEIMQNPEAFREAFLEIFMLTESHFDKERRRITFTQKDREMVNLISHLLLEKGIRPWIYEEEDLYRLKVQGEDIRAYLSNFEWRGEEPCTEEFDSAHRTVPLDAGKAERLVELLGLKHQGDMASRDWYNSYSSLQSRGRMNENHFREFLDSIESVLEERKQGMYLDFQRKARDCGLSITEVKNRTGASKYAVSNVYSYGESIPQVADFIQVEYRARIRQAEQILEHLKEFRENEVFYDRIDSIEEEDYQGKIIGLSVPETHNYIAGLGACGINHNTYPLPEAQKDRFMMKLELDYPPKENERKIVDRFTSELNYSPKLENVLSKPSLIKLQEFTRQVPIADDIKHRAVEIVSETREHEDLNYGASPRASINLVLAGKGRALVEGRNYVSESDIDRMAKPVLRHRLGINFRAEKEGKDEDDVIEEIVDEV
ncbi:MAG: LAGLIDADG family homing endonuclease [Candidatus Nanohaloarchaea archaeon]